MPKDNLIERLRHPERATVPYQSLGDLCHEAADALTRKQALIEEMVEGLNLIGSFSDTAIGFPSCAYDMRQTARSLITKATEGDCGL